MADHTKIEWTDATWQIITGCDVVSPGCTNCYAMQLAGTRLRNIASRKGLTKEVNGRHVWTGEVRFNEQYLTQPLRRRRPRRIFVAAHGDIFHESVPDEWLDKIFAVMALAPHHTFQILTKRPERMREYLRWKREPSSAADWYTRIDAIADAAYALMATWPDDAWNEGRALQARGHVRGAIYGNPAHMFPNVWLGVSVEDQKRADERIPLLLDTPAAIRWISAEPLLGPIDLTPFLPQQGQAPVDGLAGGRLTGGEAVSGDAGLPASRAEARMGHLDWVVVGGESGSRARPMHPDWARSLRDQCAAAGVAFLFKQWGAWAPHRVLPGGDLGGDVRRGFVRVVHPSGRDDVEILTETGGKRQSEPGSRYMAMVGKKAAGRTLDGVIHDAWPAPAAAEAADG